MYSIRMRASREGKHISGAELLIEEGDIPVSAASLLNRALSHEKGIPDLINISVEALRTPVKQLPSLPVTLLDTGNAEEGKKAAREVLRNLQIPEFCIEKAFSLIEKGETMRGAVLMDLRGDRREPDKQRGIRATRMDMTEEVSHELAASLAEKGLLSNYTHIKEALVLATKVASVEGTLAELCWSDDPSYTAGYVASRKSGYVRIPNLKYEGDPRGGRVFFIDTPDLARYINEIENSPFLVNKFGGIKEFSDHHIITGG